MVILIHTTANLAQAYWRHSYAAGAGRDMPTCIKCITTTKKGKTEDAQQEPAQANNHIHAIMPSIPDGRHCMPDDQSFQTSVRPTSHTLQMRDSLICLAENFSGF